jgi:hypothetical protein
MPNNFRITGDYYVSKEGSDSNDGLTPETPKLTVQAGLNLLTTANKILVVGSGVYSESIAKTFNATSNIIADGNVILNGNNKQFSIANVLAATALTVTWDGFTFSNYNSINTGVVGINAQNSYYRNSTFINCNEFSMLLTNGVSYVTNCKFINILNVHLAPFTGSPLYILYSIFINSVCRFFSSNVAQYGITLTFANNYLDSTSPLSILNITSILINYNNIQGKIAVFANGVVSGANSNGVALSFAQHRIDYPTYNVNSISADPKFNDVRNLNFTLQSDSPHIKAANDFISNIGGTEYAVYRSASSTAFTTGATISGLTLRGNNSYTITSSPTPGTIETAPIQVQSFPGTRPLTKLEWVGNLEFNKSITAGTAGNNNVPDWDTYTSGAGASPDRLTVKMRYSTQSAQPTTNSEWDNGGYWTAGNYELFEINAKPKVDATGKGNGNPDYVESGGLGDLVPTWIQLNIKLIDTYNP